jgi:hypothetical protein
MFIAARFIRSLAALAAAILVGAPAAAQSGEIGWPREIDTDSAKIVIYQPQPESVKGINLSARSAVAVTRTGKTTPIFGVVWFSARTQTDRDNRTVLIDQVAVANVRFTGITEAQEKTFRTLVDPQIAKWQFTIALDRFSASLEDAAAERRSADSLDTTPPAIVTSNVPAALLLYAGDPIMQGMAGTPFKRAVNTPMMVVWDSAAGTFYLNGGPLWYSAKNALGPWAKITAPPAPVKALVPDSLQRDSAPPGAPPKILVATKPTELIVFDGAPNWAPLTGTELLYVKNTDREVLKDLGTQLTYVLLSGRWFSSKTFDGPWAFVHPDSLPKSFAKIPPASDMGDALASVPGTPQAKDAVMDAQIPQTAAIDRATAKVTVTYDGDPKFAPVPGTSITYATNTESQVLKIGAMYYVCDKAVWFQSIGPLGPWALADSVPKSVQSIPPSSPVYNVKYVEVYQTTPTVVYVGYTPGYTSMYPYYGTVVYGTGFYYPPYYSPIVYYPRPVTYGVAVRYNPWTGFTVGFGYSTPFMHVGIVVGGPHYGGWYGPYGRPPYPPPYYRPPYGGYPGYRPPPPGYRPGAPGYGRPGGYPAPYNSNNIYKQPGNQGRVSTQPATRDMPSGKNASNRPNNVVAGKDGSVYRQNGNDWQKNQGGQWQNAGGAAGSKPSTQPANRPSTQPSTRPSVPADVPKTQQARQHGQQKTQSYNSARSSGGGRSSAPKSGGGRRP